MGTIFSKVEAKSAGIAIATPSIFNDEIWKKSPISLNSLSSQSTIAKTYFQDALAADIKAVFVYPYFIQLLIDFDEGVEAEKLIDFALTVKGIDKPLIFSKLIVLKEKMAQYKEVKKWIGNLKSVVLNDDYQTFIDKTEARIKAKKKTFGKKN